MLLYRSRLAAASVSLPNSKGLNEGSHMAVIPLLCAIFLANQGEDDATGVLSWVRTPPKNVFPLIFLDLEHFFYASVLEEFVIVDMA